jgi:drug/metabolite transporter (DMT)-like permease
MKSSAFPVFALLGASGLWGLTWLPLKHFGTFGIDGALVTLCAHGSVGLLAAPFLLARRTRWLPDWRSMAVLAVCGGLANLAFASAMVLGDVTRVMALFYLLPAWGVLLARVLIGERVDGKRAGSLVCALSGAFLVLGGPRILVAPPTWVDALATLSGLTLAFNNVVFRKAQGIPMTDKVAAVFVGSLLLAAAAQAFAAGPVPTAPARIWLEVVLFGMIWILLATAGTLFGVNNMEAGRSSVLIIMELVTAVVSSALIQRDVPDLLTCAGGALILASALLEAIRTTPARAGTESTAPAR